MCVYVSETHYSNKEKESCLHSIQRELNISFDNWQHASPYDNFLSSPLAYVKHDFCVGLSDIWIYNLQ